jgi:hypothetical protein
MAKRKLFFLMVTLSCIALVPGILEAKTVERRGIQVDYDYQQINDGFGNIRTITVAGSLRNTTKQDVSRVNLLFEFDWESRIKTDKKLKFKDIGPNGTDEFKFDIDLGSRPDTLLKIMVRIDRIKFSTKRNASPSSPRDIISHEFYTITRLAEEGKKFSSMIANLNATQAFVIPVKDEFETTNEHETRVNYAENEHFNMLMDSLETSYGEYLGGKDGVVRFIPRTVNKKLIYVSEFSLYFQVPLRLGQYNADLSQFEDVNLVPRTIPFSSKTLVPKAEIEVTHKTGMFFLRRPIIAVTRSEARDWRKNEADLALELTVRMGVEQEGAYLEEQCIVDAVYLKNVRANTAYREWLWQKMP